MVGSRFGVVRGTRNMVCQMTRTVMPVNYMAEHSRVVCQPLVKFVWHDYINVWMSCNCFSHIREALRCTMWAMAGRARCRLHGGLSTGPKTPEGVSRIQLAKTDRSGVRSSPKPSNQTAVYSRNVIR
jgi:hypothetical protein